MEEPALHPSCEPLRFLLGTWRGEGEGFYPTIDTFGYREEARFWHLGRPDISYEQRTWSRADGRPLHTESGYWRPKGNGNLEVVLAHALGIAEVEEGTISGTRIDLKTTSVSSASSAKDVVTIARTFEVSGDVLVYELALEAVGMPLQGHLRAELRRV